MTNNIESITAVYNDVELIQASLESIKDHVDKIHIVEGSWFPNQSKRSTDGTIEVIQAFKDRNPDKVEIYFHDYAPNAMHNQPGLSNANAIANAMLARQRALSCVKSDWVFMVDSDEVYKSDDLDNLIDFLPSITDSNEPFILGIPAFVFYFNENFGCAENFYKIYRLLEHPPILVSEDLFSFYEKTGYSRLDLPEDMIKMYHYSYLSKKRVENKIKFYEKKHSEDWYEEVFEKTIDNPESLDESVNYHLFSKNGYKQKYSNFNGEHPYWVRKLLIGEFI